jgi:serine/threonine-protein kinase
MEEISDLFKEEGYVLMERLAEDSWGELYRARYVPHDREVLLRRFPSAVSGSPPVWDLVCAEVGAWARLKHPGILQVLDWDISGSEAFLATEMPPGLSLGALMEAGGPGDPDAVFSNLLASVEAARQWGVLHLGLGISNIWVDDDAAVSVGEFGLWYARKDLAVPVTREEMFLAPEQLEGGRASAATDVYALALLFVTLRSGLESARAAKDGELLGMTEEQRPVIARCLDPQPLLRYRSAGELAEVLGLAGADREFTGYRDCPFCRLKEELELEVKPGRDTGHRPRSPGMQAAYAWLIIAGLAAAALILWWLALR